MTENLDVFMADFAVTCTVVGFPSFLGIFDMPGELIGVGHGDVVSDAYTLQVKTADARAVSLASGSVVTLSGDRMPPGLNGTAFTVRERLPEDDGAFTRFTLRK